MIKRRFLILLASALVAGSAQATPLPAPFGLVAGWDHSQYLAPGAATIDGTNLATQIPANYSDLDTSFGAGIQSAAFGTLFLVGNGASANATAVVLPTSQTAAPAVDGVGRDLPDNEGPVGDVQFDAQTVLLAEAGQAFFSLSAMIANDASSIVYSADLGGGPFGNDWRLDLAGLAQSGASVISIDVSTDGASYTNGVASINLGGTAAEKTVDFGSALDGESQVFVRLNFDEGTPVIDNVGLSAEIVPEPGTVLLVGAGLIGLAHASRRRA